MIMSVSIEERRILNDLNSKRRELRELRVWADTVYEGGFMGNPTTEQYNQTVRDCLTKVSGYIQTAMNLGFGRTKTVQKAQKEISLVYHDLLGLCTMQFFASVDRLKYLRLIDVVLG